VKIDRDGPITVLTLSRPAKLNAMDAAEWSALHEAIREAEGDPEVRSLLLRGSGRAFCAGNDIDAMRALRTRAEAERYFLDGMLPAFAAMAESPLPIVAEVHGDALGGGLELVQFCDIVLAADSARFALPEARIGVWATVFLGAAPHLGQHRIAKDLSLTAEPVSAADALHGGLVSRVVPAADLADAARTTALAAARNGPEALAHSKRFANRALLEHGLPAVRDALRTLIRHTLFGAECAEGVDSFVAKRPPRFAGATRG